MSEKALEWDEIWHNLGELVDMSPGELLKWL